MGPTLALFLLFLMPIGCSSQACIVLNKSPAINEHSPVGTLVTEIQLGVGYTVEVEPLDTFRMSGQNMQIIRDVDYEVEQVLRATLTCRKDGVFNNRETLIVQIININDNAPYFKQHVYTFNISESLSVNSPIGNAIEAEDDDQDILYYMLSGNANAVAYFHLSSDTNPVILVTKRLDYDDYPTVNLNLTVRDTQIAGAVASNTATASIVIHITDADDKPPFFMPCRAISSKICINDGYRGRVNRSEQARGPLTLAPGPLYAVDGDWAIGAPVQYAIISGNHDSVFNIDTTSGNITMNKAVDTTGDIFLQVMASQTDDQTKYSTTSVVIEVKEKNSFPPTFEKSNYHGFIPSNSAIDTLVLDSNVRNRPLVVFATDDDFPDKQNPYLVYRIDNNPDFRILRDGFIMTNVVITIPGLIQLQVSATDSLTNEVTSTLVSVDIIAATTTTTTTPGTGTTVTSTKGTGTTTTLTPGTGTTSTTTKGTGTTKPPLPGTGTTTTTTKGTGTTQPPAPGTGTTTTTTKGTGTTKPPAPVTGTTTTTTKGTGTTKPPAPGTGSTTTKGTGTTTISSPGTGTTTTTSKGTGTTTTRTPGTGTSTITPHGTGTTKSTTIGTGTTLSGASNTPIPRTDSSATSRPVADFIENDKVYTVNDMAALGASLGVILALCLVVLGFLIHKQYGNTIKRKLWANSGDNSENKTEQLINDIDDSTNDLSDYGGFSTNESTSSNVTLATAAVVSTTPLQSAPDDNKPSETAEQADDTDDKKVKSILTKELKEDVGYKSVWFREDAAPEVVVIEGVEDGEADDDDVSEEDFNNQQEDGGDEDDEEDLDPTFNTANNMPQNSIL